MIKYLQFHLIFFLPMHILTQNEVLWDIFFFVRITGWEQSYLIAISTGLSRFIISLIVRTLGLNFKLLSNLTFIRHNFTNSFQSNTGRHLTFFWKRKTYQFCKTLFFRNLLWQCSVFYIHKEIQIIIWIRIFWNKNHLYVETYQKLVDYWFCWILCMVHLMYIIRYIPFPCRFWSLL